jgi:hypothetical protein
MRKLSKLMLVGLVALLALTAALQPQFSTYAAKDLLRLTIDNRDPGVLSLRLINDLNVYRLKVPGGTRSLFTIKPGTYDYQLSGCGVTRYGRMTFTKNTVMVNPICGGAAHVAAKTGKVDLSVLLKVARIYLENDTGAKVVVFFDGPQDYVFSLPKNAERSYTVAKGVYKVSYVACGENTTRTFEAYPGKTLTLTCK